MRWEDERYVRLYTRDTLDWLSLSFEAQGLLALLLRKVDRAGLLELGKHGKSDVPLEERKFRAAEVTEAQREQAEQIREYLEIQKQVLHAKEDLVNEVIKRWPWKDPKQAHRTSFQRAIAEFCLERTVEAVEIVSGKEDLRYDSDGIRYFHGVLKRWRNERESKQASSAPPKPSPSAIDIEALMTKPMREMRVRAFDERMYLLHAEMIDGDFPESERSQWLAGWRVACLRMLAAPGLINFFCLQPREDVLYLECISTDLCPGGFSIDFVIRGGEMTRDRLQAEFEPISQGRWMRPHPALLAEIDRIKNSDKSLPLPWRLCDEGE